MTDLIVTSVAYYSDLRDEVVIVLHDVYDVLRCST